ncbi:MAG: hypothetical protein EA382_04360 [Spirochaetaceae bacterium]|nr:MAG: hypothetical protein EA382_04360 [Spirochaetaceae bacterium]
MADTRSMTPNPLARSILLGAGLVLALIIAPDLIAVDRYLVNRTAGTLYVLDAAAAEITPDARYRQVPVDGLLPVVADAALRGFSFERGSFSLSTFHLTADRVRALTSREAGRAYIPIEPRHLSPDPALLPSSFANVLALPRIDNQYLDWVGRDAQIARGRGRPPIGTFADFGDGREPLTVDQTLLWGRGGTDLQWVKGVATDTDFYLAISAYSSIGSRTSLFLYLYERDGALPIATLELPATHSPGFVFLWVPTLPEPIVAGNLAVSEFFLEAQIWRDVLGTATNGRLVDAVVEVATANSSAGIWEEFVLARIAMESLFVR